MSLLVVFICIPHCSSTHKTQQQSYNIFIDFKATMVSKLPSLQLNCDNSANPEELVVSLHGIDKVWSFKSKINVPISHIESIQIIDPFRTRMSSGSRLIKVAGAGIGHYKVGTFIEYKRGESKMLVFSDVHHSKPANNGQIIAITLRNERYKKLILEINDESSDRVVEVLSKECKN